MELNFDAESVEPGSFEPIPAGEYPAIIIASEEKETKAGTGHYLMLTFQIIEGNYKDRQLWARLNLDNPNSKAVQIARGELSSICRAVNVMKPKTSMELHNLPLGIKVTIKNRSDTGEPSNEIKGYRSMGGATPPPATETATAPWATQ